MYKNTKYNKNNTLINSFEYIRGAFLGIEYLHSKGIVHGDIACRNVIVCPDPEDPRK